MFRTLFTLILGAVFGVLGLLLTLVYAPDRVVPLLPDTVSTGEPITLGVSQPTTSELADLTAELTALKEQVRTQASALSEMRAQAGSGDNGPNVSLRTSESPPLTIARLDKLDSSVSELRSDVVGLQESMGTAENSGASGATAARLDEIDRRVSRLSNTRIADLAYQLARHEQALAEIRGVLDLPDDRDAPGAGDEE